MIELAKHGKINLYHYSQYLADYQNQPPAKFELLHDAVWTLSIWLAFLEMIQFDTDIHSADLAVIIKNRLSAFPSKKIEKILLQAKLLEALPIILKTMSNETFLALLLRMTFAQTRQMFLSIQDQQFQLGWSFEDPQILEAQGTLSKQVAQSFLNIPPP
ncbi:MAG: hypothetical protein E6K54_06980 [Gammaproteobacteria bacterium]|nr:MAG: hypothetical protein E6K54_06980 [Gammaproteobacteria bacterium]